MLDRTKSVGPTGSESPQWTSSEGIPNQKLQNQTTRELAMAQSEQAVYRNREMEFTGPAT